MSPSSARPIKLHRCDVENCEDTSATMVEKGEIYKIGRKYSVAGAPNDVSYKNNTHIPYISIHSFSKDISLWSNGRVSIVDIEKILPFNVVGLILRTGSKSGRYEHIPLDKYGEVNQRI